MAGLWDDVNAWWENLFKPLDEKKRQEVLHPGNAFPKVDRDRLGPQFARQYNRPVPRQTPSASVSRTPYSPTGSWSAEQGANDFAKASRSYQQRTPPPDDMYAAAKARMNPSLNPPASSLDMTPGGINAIQQGPAEKSLMEQILETLDDPYGGFKGQVDTSALDQALRSTLDQINQVRGRTNQNYQTSDRNLAGMFGAHEHDVRTTGKAAFEDISNDQIAGLNQVRQDTVGELQQYKDQENAKRMAMLKNLGIQASGATPSDTSAYDQGIASITNRSQAELANAQGDKAGNLAYNTTVANAIGQQGTQNRAELTQQLQSILGRLGMAETEANQQYGLQKSEMVNRAKEQDYNRWLQERQFNQSRYNDLFGQQQRLEDREWDMQRWQMEQMAKQNQMPEVQGFAGLAEDLVNTYNDPQSSQRAMQVLSQIVTSPDMGSIPEGWGKVEFIANRLKENGIPDMMALQLATNYGNLGNVNGYTPLG
jgi:hypothetical protein